VTIDTKKMCRWFEPASVIYYEAQIVDADNDLDATVIGRVVYV